MTDVQQERRQHRRLELVVPILTRRFEQADDLFKEGVTKNLSLAGVYFTTAAWRELTPNDQLAISISVPREKAREFPFSRIAGRGRIIRVEELAKIADNRPRLLGVALEFGEDLTVLTMAPGQDD